MGLHEASEKIYLRVSGGRIVKTATANTPKAISRENKKGETVWELIWESISGTLTAVVLREHPEYGRSWNLTIVDDQEYTLQIHEDSRFGMDFLKKFPGIFQGGYYTFKPWEMEKNGKKKSGLSITDANSEKVENFYQTFTDLGDGKWDIQNLPGYPEYEGEKNDEDDLKIYFVKLAKYLRFKAQEHLRTGFIRADEPGEEKHAPAKQKDDLPF